MKSLIEKSNFDPILYTNSLLLTTQIHIDSGPYLINVSMHRQKFIYVFTEMLYPTTWILKVLHIDSLLVTMQHSSIFSTTSNTGSYDKTLLYILNWNHIFNESILLIFSYKFVVDDNAVFVSFQGLTSSGAGFCRKFFYTFLIEIIYLTNVISSNFALFRKLAVDDNAVFSRP